MFLGGGPSLLPHNGPLYCGPGKMRGLVILSLASACYPLLGISPSRQLAFIFLFLANVKPGKYGACFSSFKHCTGAQTNLWSYSSLQNAPCQLFSWPSLTLPSASLLSWVTLAALLTGSWFLASCLAPQPQTSSASCYVIDDTPGLAGSLVISQDRLC